METLLITTDFSKTAANAALYAVELGKALGIRSIILYHSYDNAPKGTDIPVHEEDDTTLAHEGSLLALELLAGQLRTCLDEHTDIQLVSNDLPLLFGVERLCGQHPVRLVVSGTTGKSGITKFLLGSNTLNLADKCPVPLLVVPADAEFEPVRKIVFACAFHRVKDITPVDDIRYFTKKLGANLLVLNVGMEDKRFDPDIIPEQYQLHRMLDDLSPKYHYVEEESIAEGILEFVEDEEADLVITVPKTYGFFDSLFKRSVTKKLAFHTKTPLLILRERDEREK